MNTAQLLREGKDHVVGGRFVEAERCYRAALKAESGNPIALNGLGLALHGQGRLNEARHFLSEAIERAPESIDAHFNLGILHHEHGHFDLALSCFEEVLRRTLSDADTFAAIGSALERKGRFDEAVEYFTEAEQVSRNYSVARMLRFSAGFLREIEAVRKSASLPAPILQSNPGDVLESVALVACDANYLRKYGAAFANSFVQSADSAILLHLHMLDSDSSIKAEIEILFKRVGITRYCVTAEQDDRFAPGSRAKHVWYTCARFVHLEAWLRAYDVPIVALDIDAAIQAPLTKLVGAVVDADLGLYLRQPRRLPWLDIVANTLVARPTVGALDYLRLVRNYIEHFLALDSPKWHLDQCALYCTFRMLEAHNRAPAVRWITDTANATVYQVGHSHDERMADSRYARFVFDC